MLRLIVLGGLLLFLVTAEMFAEDENPLSIAICDLQKNPDTYNHKLVQVQGTVSHEFENFSVHDTGCPVLTNSVWLMYGGDISDDVTYCCNGTGNKNQVKIEGIEVSIKKNALLDRFKKLLNSYRIEKKAKIHYLQTDPSFSVTTTLIGRFFAGNKKALSRGFGHMGCCTLLVIEEVLSIDNVGSNIKPGELSCYTEGWQENRGYKEVTISHNSVVKAGENWRKKDPRRVATETLNSYLNDSNRAVKFSGCKTKHLTYPDKKYDQYWTYCFWISNTGDSYTVEVAKYFFLKNPLNRWKDIAWMPYSVSHQHCSESRNLE